MASADDECASSLGKGGPWESSNWAQRAGTQSQVMPGVYTGPVLSLWCDVGQTHVCREPLSPHSQQGVYLSHPTFLLPPQLSGSEFCCQVAAKGVRGVKVFTCSFPPVPAPWHSAFSWPDHGPLYRDL